MIKKKGRTRSDGPGSGAAGVAKGVCLLHLFGIKATGGALGGARLPTCPVMAVAIQRKNPCYIAESYFVEEQEPKPLCILIM